MQSLEGLLLDTGASLALGFVVGRTAAIREHILDMHLSLAGEPEAQERIAAVSRKLEKREQINSVIWGGIFGLPPYLLGVEHLESFQRGAVAGLSFYAGIQAGKMWGRYRRPQRGMNDEEKREYSDILDHACTMVREREEQAAGTYLRQMEEHLKGVLARTGNIPLFEELRENAGHCIEQSAKVEAYQQLLDQQDPFPRVNEVNGTSGEEYLLILPDEKKLSTLRVAADPLLAAEKGASFAANLEPARLPWDGSAESLVAYIDERMEQHRIFVVSGGRSLPGPLRGVLAIDHIFTKYPPKSAPLAPMPEQPM